MKESISFERKGNFQQLKDLSIIYSIAISEEMVAEAYKKVKANQGSAYLVQV